MLVQDVGALLKTKGLVALSDESTWSWLSPTGSITLLKVLVDRLRRSPSLEANRGRSENPGVGANVPYTKVLAERSAWNAAAPH